MGKSAVTAVTEDIVVSVEVFYQYDHSRPLQNKFVFAYRVTIENKSVYTVQLMSRYWEILDSVGIKSVVQGDGVIGVQPVISPNESYTYVSWSQLQSDVGTMQGYYLMLRGVDKEMLQIKIPRFHLIAPFKQN